MKKLNTTIAQIKLIPMDIKANLYSMSLAVNEAKKNSSDVIVFPELCVSGYLLGDRFEYEDFIEELQSANQKILAMSQGIIIIWGNIVSDPTKINEDGRLRKYNAVLIAQNGEWVSNGILPGYMPKNNLPKYRIFDDARHFYPAYKLAAELGMGNEDFFKAFPVSVRNETYKLALTVCEDMWEDEYNIHLSRYYKAEEVDLLIDISASPWTLGKWHARESMLLKRVKDISAPVLYVNCIGLQNNGKNIIWFDGGSTLVSGEGNFVWRAESNGESITTVNIFGKDVNTTPYTKKENIIELYDCLTSAMREFYKDFNKIVIGLSGGIDSALALALLASVVPKEKILAINMPTKFNSQTTQDLAKLCASNLDVEYQVVPIGELYKAQLQVLTNSGATNITTLTKENIQARIRGQQLATISAHHKGVFTNNGNKTEVALNYFTLYGDAAGAAAFLGDIWKGQVYELSRYINQKAGKDVIPNGILTIIPSAELSENQNVDEGKGDPIFYEYHDKILYAFTELRWDITKVLATYAAGTLEKDLAIPEGTIKKYFHTHAEYISNLEWAWNAYNSEYKRVQLPPVFLTSRRAFGFDRRDTIAPPFFSHSYQNMKQKLLTTSDTAP